MKKTQPKNKDLKFRVFARVFFKENPVEIVNLLRASWFAKNILLVMLVGCLSIVGLFVAQNVILKLLAGFSLGFGCLWFFYSVWRYFEEDCGWIVETQKEER